MTSILKKYFFWKIDIFLIMVKRTIIGMVFFLIFKIIFSYDFRYNFKHNYIKNISEYIRRKKDNSWRRTEKSIQQ